MGFNRCKMEDQRRQAAEKEHIEKTDHVPGIPVTDCPRGNTRCYPFKIVPGGGKRRAGNALEQTSELRLYRLPFVASADVGNRFFHNGMFRQASLVGNAN
jgi:hypothetical protein